MEIPNNRERPRRITRNNNDPDALRRIFRDPNNNGNGFIRRLMRTFDDMFYLICQVVKYLFLFILGSIGLYYGGRIFLLLLIGSQNNF